jgi:TRAP-type C4-dicarboxylate transport system, periplasmic component
MSWADAQPAMASGAVDGQENPVSVYMAAKLNTVGQKHLTLWGYMNDPLIYVVNKDVWASWTKEDQAIVKQAALDAAKEQIVISRKGMSEADKPLVKELTALGVTVTDLNAAQRKVFADATKSVYTKWKPQIGTNLVDMAEKAIAERKK